MGWLDFNEKTSKASPRASFGDNPIIPTSMVPSNKHEGALETAQPLRGDIMEAYGLNNYDRTPAREVMDGVVGFAKSALAGLKSYSDPDIHSFGEGAINQSLKDIDNWETSSILERNKMRDIKLQLTKDPQLSGAYAQSFSELGHSPEQLSGDQNVLMDNVRRFQQSTRYPDSTNAYYGAMNDPVLGQAIAQEQADKLRLFSTMKAVENAKQPSYGLGTVLVPDPNTGELKAVERPSATNLRRPEDIRHAQEVWRKGEPMGGIPVTDPKKNWWDSFSFGH